MTLTGPATATYVGTAVLPGGTIRFRGVVRKRESRSVLTGGTGRYADVEGSISEPSTDKDPENSTNVYHLVLR